MTPWPPKAFQFVWWFVNFATQVTLDPAAYGLTSGDAVIMTTAASDCLVAWYARLFANWRCEPLRRDYYTARDNAMSIFQMYTNYIIANPAVTIPALTAIGLHKNR